jgi:lauroyl/myristoyl acyltransferase
MARARRYFFRTAEFCFAMAMRLVPEGRRFTLAWLVARATVPLFRITEGYRKHQTRNFLDPHEISLFLLLNALTRNGTTYDVKIAVDGYQHFARACDLGKGVLVIGHHAALTWLMIRYFHDKGFDPVVVSPDRQLRVAGTALPARVVQPSQMFLVQLRSRLRSGDLVCAMPDRREHHGTRTLEFATSAGQVIIAPAMIQVAARCGAEVVFTEVRLEGRKLIATIDSPALSSARIASAITDDFISFVRARTAAARPSYHTRMNSLNLVAKW